MMPVIMMKRRNMMMVMKRRMMIMIMKTPH